MKKLIFILIALLLLVLFIPAVLFARVALDFSNPLRQSEEQIKENLLELTPVGTSIEYVLEVLDSNEDWEIAPINYGIWIINYASESRNNIRGYTGSASKSIYVDLGQYPVFFDMLVVAEWTFDEDFNLNDIDVRKSALVP